MITLVLIVFVTLITVLGAGFGGVAVHGGFTGSNVSALYYPSRDTAMKKLFYAFI